MKEQHKKLYEKAVKEVTNIFDQESMINILIAITNANKLGLQVLDTQLKIHRKYIKNRLKDYGK